MLDSAPILAPQPTCLVPAESDREIVDFYLNQLDDFGEPRFSRQTISNYRRDIRRLDVYLNGKPYSEISLADVQGFKKWLAEPPAEFISTNAKLPAGHKDWKPFYKKGLSRVSMRQQIVSIKALFGWLSDIGYITRNVFILSKTPPPPASTKTHNHLTIEHLSSVATYFNQAFLKPGISKKRIAQLNRQRWVFYGYLFSGLRISELPELTTGAIYTESYGGNEFWMMAVKGKGRKEADPHQLPDTFIKELKRYRRSIGRDEWPLSPEPLIFNLKGTKAVTSRSWAHEEFKSLIYDVAQTLNEAGNYEAEARLLASSTHWLRHSFTTELLNVTTDIPAASKLARHKDIKTTMIYDHSEKQELSLILKKLESSISTPEY